MIFETLENIHEDFDLRVGFGHAQCMSNLKACYVEITHSHQISIFQSSNNWTCTVQIIVSAAVLKLGSFKAERINHIIKIQAAGFLTGTVEEKVYRPWFLSKTYCLKIL